MTQILTRNPDRSSIVASSVVVVIAAALAIGLTVGAVGVAADASPPDDETDEYVLVQGDDCVPIEPIGDGTQSVEEFYDYRTPETSPSGYTYSSEGTTHLQADDTSVLFLYEGSDGVSLVVIHDQFDGDSEGGAVTMTFDGLPAEGEWVVEDDNYSDDIQGGPYDEWDHGETTSHVTWTWAENRTDGGAFNGGLEDDVRISIDPAFNDQADFQEYPGEVTDWQALSGDEDDPERTALEMDEPVTLQSGSCVSIGVTEVSTEGTVAPNESTEIEATVENDGALAASTNVTFAVDGEPIDEQEVSLDAGNSTVVTTDVVFEETGTYTVEAGNESAEITVEDDEADGSDDADDDAADETDEDQLPGFGIAVSALAALLAVLIASRRA